MKENILTIQNNHSYLFTLKHYETTALKLKQFIQNELIYKALSLVLKSHSLLISSIIVETKINEEFSFFHHTILAEICVWFIFVYFFLWQFSSENNIYSKIYFFFLMKQINKYTLNFTFLQLH